MIIKLDNISISYGKTLALDNLSLSIERDAVGLLGPNGAGKTTLLKVLLGFLSSDTGYGEVLGMDIESRQLEIRKRVGYMPENDCYIPNMNAVSFVAYAGKLCGMPSSDAMERAHEILHYVGLGEARYRMVETYSAGMRQRIKLAQALIHDPELLFLDEPTNGMDPSGRKEMLDLIKNISTEKDIHIILSSHLLPDVEYACDDVIVLHQGQLVVQGDIEDLRDDYRRLFELKIRGDKAPGVSADQPLGETRFMSELEKLDCKLIETESSIWRVALPENFGSEVFFKLAAKHGIQLRHLRPTRYSLEDIFAQAVEE